MILPLTLPLLAAPAGPDCAYPGPRHAGRWLRGTHVAVPVAAERQGEVMARLGARRLERVDFAAARGASSDSDLPPATHYYLATAAAYLGRAEGRLVIPPTMSLSLEVDSRGTGYVTTFLLTHQRAPSEFAVVLASNAPLRRVVPVCMAAE